MPVKGTLANYAQKINDTQSVYVLWVKFSKEAFGLACIVGSVYLPGESSIHRDRDMFDAINDDILLLKNRFNLPLCLIGDFNSRTGDLDDSFSIESSVVNNCGLNDFANDLFNLDSNNENLTTIEARKNKDSTVNFNGELLVEFCKANDLKIVNGRCGTDRGIGDFTFIKNENRSTIDYCIASPDLFSHILNFEIDLPDSNLSDFHSAISLTVKANYCRSFKNNTRLNAESDIKYEPIYSKWCNEKKLDFQAKFNSNKIEELNQHIDSLDTFNTSQRDIDGIVEVISDLCILPGLETGMSKRISNTRNRNTSKNNNKPWFDHECSEKRTHYFRIKNRLKKSKSFQNIAALKNANKSYKKLINRKIHLFNKSLHRKLRDLKSSNPKEYWNLLNPKMSKENSSIDMKSLYDHFKIINNPISDRAVDFDANNIGDEGDETLNTSFTIAELDKLIKKLKNNKAAGIDNIINEFIKFSPDNYKALLIKLFNTILLTGVIPTNWCISFISPIYKDKGLKSDPDNYRGISIISCLGKLFTALLNERLTNFININNILGEEQAGFRSGYSTQDHIFALHSIIDLYLNRFKRKKLYCAFIDYSKAFDLVDRSYLWSKLLSYNIKGKFMKLIYNLYQSTKACIKLNNSISNSFDCNIGVRQGDNLSPLLFSLFINDFETFLSDKYNGLKSIKDLSAEISELEEIDVLLKLFVLLYADDTIILAENPNDLQIALNALSDYCNRWKLKINIEKTKIIRFSKRKSHNIPEFWLNNEKVKVVDDYVYLGTTFSYNGKFQKAIKKQILQAQRALFSIKAKKEMYNLPVDIMLDLFDKMILPILLYGCEIWGFENVESIEIFYRKFLKYTMKLNIQTTNCMVYGEAGRKPLIETIKARMVCFWHKIATSETNKISSRFLTLQKNLYEQNLYTSKWLEKIEDILNLCGMRNVWLNPQMFQREWVKKAVDLRLTDMYRQEWQNMVNNKSSCNIYRTFKQTFEVEKYLLLLDCVDRINMSKFRCRNTKMPVVTLGYTGRNTPYEDRLCSICNLGEIGDEFHFIFKCTAFLTHRDNYLSQYYTRNPNMIKFAQLFQSTNVNVLKNLATFIGVINKHFR